MACMECASFSLLRIGRLRLGSNRSFLRIFQGLASCVRDGLAYMSLEEGKKGRECVYETDYTQYSENPLSSMS